MSVLLCLNKREFTLKTNLKYLQKYKNFIEDNANLFRFTHLALLNVIQIEKQNVFNKSKVGSYLLRVNNFILSQLIIILNPN